MEYTMIGSETFVYCMHTFSDLEVQVVNTPIEQLHRSVNFVLFCGITTVYNKSGQSQSVI